MPWTDVGMKRMLTDWLKDPIRRRNVASRVFEGACGASASVVFCGIIEAVLHWVPLAWVASLLVRLAAFSIAILLGVLVEFLVYEFILEPKGLAGPYFERGPRDGETFIYW